MRDPDFTAFLGAWLDTGLAFMSKVTLETSKLRPPFPFADEESLVNGTVDGDRRDPDRVLFVLESIGDLFR